MKNDDQNPKTPPIISMESESFYRLIKQVVERLKNENKTEKETDFIGEKETMKLLGISSKSTLQKYRDFSYITFYKINARKILYSKSSIEKFIRENKQSLDD